MTQHKAPSSSSSLPALPLQPRPLSPPPPDYTATTTITITAPTNATITILLYHQHPHHHHHHYHPHHHHSHNHPCHQRHQHHIHHVTIHQHYWPSGRERSAQTLNTLAYLWIITLNAPIHLSLHPGPSKRWYPLCRSNPIRALNGIRGWLRKMRGQTHWKKSINTGPSCLSEVIYNIV